jgi:hypothetical protein
MQVFAKRFDSKGSIDMPTRQSFIVEMVGEKKDLSNAIALNSTMVNSARLLGPSLAGILIDDRHRSDDHDGFKQHPFTDCCRG